MKLYVPYLILRRYSFFCYHFVVSGSLQCHRHQILTIWQRPSWVLICISGSTTLLIDSFYMRARTCRRRDSKGKIQCQTQFVNGQAMILRNPEIGLFDWLRPQIPEAFLKIGDERPSRENASWLVWVQSLVSDREVLFYSHCCSLNWYAMNSKHYPEGLLLSEYNLRTSDSVCSHILIPSKM